MNFLNLEYFLVVAKELNITKAASILNLSQQSLSKHILNLENELGMPLFDRGPRLCLTEAGACFAVNVTRILDLKNQTLTQMQDIKNHENNDIRIGITSARSPIYLPCFLPQFHQLFPEAKIVLLERSSEDIFSALLEGKIDIAIGLEPEDKLNFINYPLCREDYVILIPSKLLHTYFSAEEIHTFTSCPEKISIELFKDFPFLCHDNTKRIGRIFKKICLRAGFEPNVILESANFSTLLSLCACGLGVLICPAIYITSKNQSKMLGSVCAYPLRDSAFETNIVVTLPQNRYASRLTREFIRIIKQEFAKADVLTEMPMYPALR